MLPASLPPDRTTDSFTSRYPAAAAAAGENPFLTRTTRSDTAAGPAPSAAPQSPPSSKNQPMTWRGRGRHGRATEERAQNTGRVSEGGRKRKV